MLAARAALGSMLCGRTVGQELCNREDPLVTCSSSNEAQPARSLIQYKSQQLQRQASAEEEDEFHKIGEEEDCGPVEGKSPSPSLPGPRRRRMHLSANDRRKDCEEACVQQGVMCQFFYVADDTDGDEWCRMYFTCSGRTATSGGLLYGKEEAKPTTTQTTTQWMPDFTSSKARPYVLHGATAWSGPAWLRKVCTGHLPGHAECIINGDSLGGILPFVTLYATGPELQMVLNAYPDIEFVERDASIAAGPHEDIVSLFDENDKVPWGLDRIDSRGMTAGLDDSFADGGPSNRGRSVHIYVVSTGISDHVQFGDRLVPTLDVVELEGVAAECAINGLEENGFHSKDCTRDLGGHGTHFAGTAAGASLGIASKATIHAVRVVASYKRGRASWLLSALYWIAANGERPAVVSLGLESDWKPTRSYKVAVDTLQKAGVTVVVPSGSRIRGGPADACNDFLQHETAVTVGATGIMKEYSAVHDYYSDFSNGGTCVDILAPGIGITTASAWGLKDESKVTGVSMAAAHTAGAAACLLGSGNLQTSSPAEVRESLLKEAKGLNRRRREPQRQDVRRRVTYHRALGDTPDKMLYVSGGVGAIHRRRESTIRRRRRTTPAPAVHDEASPKILSRNKVPVYGTERAKGRWLINFKLPPDGFQYYKASYSKTMATDFCTDLNGSATCTLKGRPHAGGIPFAALTATEAELEAILDRFEDKISNKIPEVEFVEADMELTAIAQSETPTETQEQLGPMPATGRRRRGLSWGLDRIDSLYTLDGAYMVPKSGGHRVIEKSIPIQTADRVATGTKCPAGTVEGSSNQECIYPGLNVTAHIYVLDSGMRTTHRDFEGRAKPTLDLSSGCLRQCADDDASCAADATGHGTHVAAVVGGRRYGVAKSSVLHAVKVLDEDGKGWVSWTIAALDWVSRKGVAPKVAVLNAENTGFSKTLQRAVDFANIVGRIALVVGAGATGGNTCANLPANVETRTLGGKIGAGTIAVGATTQGDRLADYSGKGSCVDYLAPGDAISTASHSDDHSETLMNGVPLASAHVAGAAALYFASEQAIDPEHFDRLLTLAIMYDDQIDYAGQDMAGMKNRFINVRHAAAPPELSEDKKTCTSCQYSRSGCPCKKSWEYMYQGKTHTCNDYCCNPYGDPLGPFCATEGKCTIRVDGELPKRELTDYCDTVPGKRLTGGWVEKPHVYPSTGKKEPVPDPEDECAVSSPTKWPNTTIAVGTTLPTTAAGTTASATTVPVTSSGPSTSSIKGAFTGTPKPETVLGRMQTDIDCLLRRLQGKVCG